MQRLFGSNEQAQLAAECRHETLTPRWRGPDEMEDDSRAMGFVCHACSSEFPPYQVRDRQLIRHD